MKSLDCNFKLSRTKYQSGLFLYFNFLFGCSNSKGLETTYIIIYTYSVKTINILLSYFNPPENKGKFSFLDDGSGKSHYNMKYVTFYFYLSFIVQYAFLGL